MASSYSPHIYEPRRAITFLHRLLSWYVRADIITGREIGQVAISVGQLVFLRDFRSRLLPPATSLMYSITLLSILFCFSRHCIAIFIAFSIESLSRLIYWLRGDISDTSRYFIWFQYWYLRYNETLSR